MLVLWLQAPTSNPFKSGYIIGYDLFRFTFFCLLPQAWVTYITIPSVTSTFFTESTYTTC